MEIDRCPKCTAGIRSDAQWCTLCYADLRAPLPVPAAAPPVAAPAAGPPAAPLAALAAMPQPAGVPGLAAVPGPAERSVGSADLATAYEELLAFSGAAPQSTTSLSPTQPPALPTQTAPAPRWPCTTCHELNLFDVTTCHVCGASFGAGLAGPRPEYNRQQVLIWGIGAAVLLVLLVGLLSFIGTNGTPDPAPLVPGTEAPLEPGVDGSVEAPGETIQSAPRLSTFIG